MKSGLLASSIILALGLCSALHASADGSKIKNPPWSVLYDQNNSDSGHSIPSFSGNSAFDSIGADDFVVPVGDWWQIREVDVTTRVNRKLDYVMVTVYRNAGGLPGSVIESCYVRNGNFSRKITYNGGILTIQIGGPSGRHCLGHLHGGNKTWKTYWISVVAGNPHKWVWETRTVALGAKGAWQNPNGGYQTNCYNWRHLPHCWSSRGEDFMFTLKGKEWATRR